MALHTSELRKDDIPKLRNIPVVTSDGEEIGHVGDAYYDEGSERLECVGVAADAIGLSKRVIPVTGATIDDDGKLRLPYTRAQVEGAPDWEDSANESQYDERWNEVGGYYRSADEDAALTRSGGDRVDSGGVRLRRWSEDEPVERVDVDAHTDRS